MNTDIKTKLVVVNENILGYIQPELPEYVGILRALITEGAAHSTFDDPFLLKSSDNVRLASEKDFEKFQVSFSGYNNSDEYEFQSELLGIKKYIGQELELTEMPQLQFGNPNVTIGNKYKIIDTEGSNFWLIDDDGLKVSFGMCRFNLNPLTMKDLIIKALGEAIIKLDRITPQTKQELIYVNIEQVNPKDIVEFMKENNIPDDADFAGKPNGYDAFNEVCLCYGVSVPTTAKDQLNYKRGNFSRIAGKVVGDTLKNNGYKRIPCDGILLREFKNTNEYDMFISNEFDKLEKYYTIFYKKGN